jgi:class 3 adenylate cyclase/CHASE2 domain-containing sensor protein
MANETPEPASAPANPPTITSSPKKKKQKGASAVDLMFVAFGIFVALSTHKTFGFLEARTYDLRLKAAASLKPVPDQSQTVLAPIDDVAVQRYGRWPWSRDRWKPLLETMADVGVTSVIFDIEYPEASEPVLRRSATGQSFLMVIGKDLADIVNQLSPALLVEQVATGMGKGLANVRDGLLLGLNGEGDDAALAKLAEKALAEPRGKRKEGIAADAKTLEERLLAFFADNAEVSKTTLSDLPEFKDEEKGKLLDAAGKAERALNLATLQKVLADKPDRPDAEVLDAAMAVLAVPEKHANYQGIREGMGNNILRTARARAVARTKDTPVARLFEHLIAAAGELAGGVVGKMGTSMIGRLDALKAQLERVMRSPDSELAAAGITCRLAGTPIFGVFYAAGGLSFEQARKDADLDEEVRASLTKPVKVRLDGNHPGRFLEVYPRILRCLSVNPLASPDDEIFKKLMLTPEAVRPSLQSAREQVLGHALDLVLHGKTKLKDDEVMAAIAKIFEVAVSKDLTEHVLKLLPSARARSIVLDRFLIRYPSDNLPDSIVFKSFTPPIPELASAFSGLAVSTVPPDGDGVMRRVPLFRQVESGLLPGLGFLLYLHRVGFTPDKPDEIKAAMSIEPGPVVRLKTPKRGEVAIPLDPSGGLLLRMQGIEEMALDRLPITAVMDYQAHKNRLREVWERVDTNQDSPYATAIAQAAEELMLAGDQPVTFDTVQDRAKALGLEQMRTAEELLPDAKPEERADKRAPSDWVRLAKQFLERKLKSYEDTLAHRAKKFRKKSPEEQAKALAKPGSEWAELMQRVHSIEELAHMRVELEKRLKGRSVIIGAAQTGNTDSAPTPFASKEPNYALHGHAIATLMGGQFIHRPHHSRSTLAPVVALAVLLGIVLPRVSLSWGALWALFVWAAWGVASVALLAYRGMWVDVVAPSMSVLITYLGLSYWRYKTVEQSKAIYREMFEAYLDKRVIEQFVERPELFKEIGGVSCEITAFFSDIEGFTTISELCSPEQLSAMLTDYLTPMTDIIQARGGLRDKYIGDAIVAMWGAPLHSPDHAVQGCLASLEQRERLNALKKDERLLADPKSWLSHLRSKGRDFNARMGVNTGIAKVGNFGSARSKNYTMIGDTVNLAARLEGANKAFGTYLMISEFTYAQARDYIEARPLDSIRVKGKLRPVTVYELMAKKGDLSEKMCEVREIYVKARNLHLEQRFEEAIAMFKQALALKEDDAPCLTLMHRCEHYLEAPPPKDWDGTYDLKEK